MKNKKKEIIQLAIATLLIIVSVVTVAKIETLMNEKIELSNSINKQEEGL